MSRNIRSIIGHNAPVTCLQFGSAGTRLYSGSEDRSVRIWDLLSGEQLQQFVDPIAPVRSIAVDRDERLLLTAASSFDRRGRLQVRDAIIGDSKRIHENSTEFTNVRDVTFSPTYEIFACVGNEGTLFIGETLSGRMIFRTLANPTGCVSVAFHPAGSLIAVGGYDGVVTLHAATTGERLHTLSGLREAVNKVAFSPDNRLIAACEGRLLRPGKVLLWDSRTGAVVRTLEGHTNRVFSIAFSPTEPILATAGADGVVFLWDLDSGETTQVLHVGSERILSTAFSPDGRLLAAGCGDNAIRIWEVESGECVRVIQGPRGEVHIADFIGKDGLLVAVSRPAFNHPTEFLVWEPDTGHLRNRFPQGFSNVGCFAAHPEKYEVAFTSEGGRYTDSPIYVYSLDSRKQQQPPLGPATHISAIAYVPHNDSICTASRDGRIRLVDRLGTATVLEPRQEPLTCLSVSPNGRLIAAGSHIEGRTRGCVTVWARESGEILWSANNLAEPTAIAFSPDGTRLAIGTRNGDCRLVQAASGDGACLLGSLGASIIGFSYRADGSCLAAGSERGLMRVWEMESGSEQLTIQTTWHRIHFVRFTPDGRLLVTDGPDRSIRFWDVDAGSDRSAFYDAMNGNSDPTVRLMFADWLDEQGEHHHAAIFRARGRQLFRSPA